MRRRGVGSPRLLLLPRRAPLDRDQGVERAVPPGQPLQPEAGPGILPEVPAGRHIPPLAGGHHLHEGVSYENTLFISFFNFFVTYPTLFFFLRCNNLHSGKQDSGGCSQL